MIPTTHSISTQYYDGMKFIANIDSHAVPMDAMPEDGGHDSAAGPKKLMLAALAGCTGVDIVSILQKMKVEFSDFKIDVRGSLSDEHPKIYEDVVITYTIKLPENDQPKMEKAILLSQDKYCGVSAMFKAFANVSWEVVYL